MSAIETEVNKKLSLSEHKYKVFELTATKAKTKLLEEAVGFVTKQEPETGFLIVSCNPHTKRLIYACKSGPELSAEIWLRHISNNSSAATIELNTQSSDGVHYGELTDVPYVEKIRDDFLAHGIGILRQNKLIEEAEEEDYIDPEAYGLGSW